MTPHTDTDLTWLDDILIEIYDGPRNGLDLRSEAKTAIANKLASEVLEARIDELDMLPNFISPESWRHIKNQVLSRIAELKASTTQSKEP